MHIEQAGGIMRLGLIALVGVLLPLTAMAQDCQRDRALLLYRAAATAQEQGRLADAKAVFQPLAAEGFAPAQRRLGEILRQQGQREEAYLQILLAAKGGDALARTTRSRLEQEIDVGRSLEVKAKADAWKPTLGPCTTDMVNRRRSGQSIKPAEILDGLTFDKHSHLADQQIYNGLGALVFKLLDTNPQLQPYLTSMGTPYISMVRSGAAGIDEDSHGAARLVLDFASIERPDRNLPAVINALREVVHRRADPPPVLESQYRGRAIKVKAYDQPDKALAVIKQGIDMAESLPADLRALASLPKRLVVDPTPFGESKESVGVLVVKAGEKDGYLRFPVHPSAYSATDVAVSMATTGYRLSLIQKGEMAKALPEFAVSDIREKARKALGR